MWWEEPKGLGKILGYSAGITFGMKSYVFRNLKSKKSVSCRSPILMCSSSSKLNTKIITPAKNRTLLSFALPPLFNSRAVEISH